MVKRVRFAEKLRTMVVAKKVTGRIWRDGYNPVVGQDTEFRSMCFLLSAINLKTQIAGIP